MRWGDLLRRPIRRMPLTPAETASATRPFRFHHTWLCPCGARLTIRSREARLDGASNFEGVHTWETIRAARTRGQIVTEAALGHSILLPQFLTWNGLAEERGWQIDPVRCPACQRGMSVAAYKQVRRHGRL